MTTQPTSDDRFQPGSWNEIQRLVGWRPCPGTAKKTKQQELQDEEARKLMEVIRQMDELRALEKKTRELGQRAKEWKKWTL